MSYLLTIIVTVVLTPNDSALWITQGSNSNAQEVSERVYEPSEIDRRAIATEKPEAKYTEAARRRKIEGIVILRAVLTASGKVEDIEVLQGLPHGLTKSAIKAAQRIKFQPALKGGRPVSVRVKLQSHFVLGI